MLSVFLLYCYATNDQVSNESLTGLMTRKRSLREIERAMKAKEENSMYVLFLLDLNDFKPINDRYGHLEGDNALRYTAEALSKVASFQKKKAIVGRYGGDEFVFGVSVEMEAEIDIIKEQIRSELSLIKEKYNTEYQVSACIGYAIYTKEANNIKDLFDEADKRLYQHKEKVKSGI